MILDCRGDKNKEAIVRDYFLTPPNNIHKLFQLHSNIYIYKILQ